MTDKVSDVRKYTTKSTSIHSAKVLQPIILSQKTTTRRVFLAIINNTKTATQETVSGTKIYTVNPKGLLVIGHTSQLEYNLEKIQTFESYRRNISNPEIVTFDELFERAKFIVKNDKC